MRKLFILLLLTSCGVQQNLTVSHRLSEGMTKAEVESIMGAPIKSDFYKNVEEWFYCKTGQYADDHIALFFHEGLLIAKKTIPLLQQTPKEPMVLVRNS